MPRWLHRRGVRVAAAAMLASAALTAVTATAGASTPLAAAAVSVPGANDLIIDEDDGLAYVSRYTNQDVQVVELATGTVVDTIAVPGVATGVELSADGLTLYVGLYDSGSVAVIDVATETVTTTLDIAETLGHVKTWELQRVGTRLFVSANPSSSGFAWIVEIDLTDGSARRVADNRIIRAAPEFAWDGGDYLYVGEGFSPNSLFKLDLTDPDVQIVLEDQHGTVSGTQRLSARPEAVLIAGKALDPDDFTTLATIGAGRPAWGPDGTFLYTANVIEGTDATLQRHAGSPLGSSPLMKGTGCTMPDDSSSLALAALSGNAGFVLLGAGILCLIPPFPASVADCDGLPPTLIGSEADDALAGTTGNDVISSLGGNDSIAGGAGTDTICGGEGVDTISFAAASGPATVSLLNGEASTGVGSLTLVGFENVVGSNYGDLITGDDLANHLVGGSGNDSIDGGAGRDLIEGGIGDDTLVGGVANDRIEAGAGTDLVFGSDGNDRLYGQDGPDYLDGGKGTDRIYGGASDDEAYGGKGDDLMLGSSGNDYLAGGMGLDVIQGDDGDDDLVGGADADTVTGGIGEDVLIGAGGDDSLSGGDDTDYIDGGAGNDVLDGGGAVDVIFYDLAPGGVTVSLAGGTATGNGNDTLLSIESAIGSPFNDTMTGTDQFNGFAGLDGSDRLYGGSAGDNLFGDGGNDFLYGESGDDWLEGGTGTDRLEGGTGYDMCLTGEVRVGCEQIAADTLGTLSDTLRTERHLAVRAAAAWLLPG